MSRSRLWMKVLLAATGVAAAIGCSARSLGAKAIVTPLRHGFNLSTDLPHRDLAFTSKDGLAMKGWYFPTAAPRRGLVVYLHGHSDNRSMSRRAAAHLLPLGFDVLAFDHRAHGESGGQHCTYGLKEKDDLSAALDAVGATEAIVIGSSLGAATALLASPGEPRITAIVAHAPFVDLRTAIADRSGFLPASLVAGAMEDLEKSQGYRVDDVSPLKVAPRVTVPVLLVHGSADPWTPPIHSRRILKALGGEKSLLLVEGAGHADALEHDAVWVKLAAWVDGHGPKAPSAAASVGASP